jgi:alpha-galactosidase
MGRWLDKTKGEYTRVYDYPGGLLRSNPGSTVVIKLDLEFKDPVF